MTAWSSPVVVLPLALALVLAVARLARLRPSLGPLVAPVALVVAIGAALLLDLRLAESRWVVLAFLLALLALLVRASVILLDGLFRRSQGSPPPALLEHVVTVFLYGLGGALIAHDWFGLNLTAFLATSAVVGAVVGLALQETLGNLFAGIALHAEAPFRVGHWIRVGESEGLVEEVSWRATTLRTRNGDTLTMPNNDVARRAILNLSHPRGAHSRTLELSVGVNTPPNKVTAVLAHLLDEVADVCRDPPPRVRIAAYRDFAIGYEVRYFIADQARAPQVEGEILRLVWYHFRRHGIDLPFPVRDVYLHPVRAGGENETPASRLDRALRAIDLFQPLTDDELRTAASRFRHLHYAAGERVIEEGSPGDSFFVIDRGEVEVSKEFSGVRRPVARLMEGQFFGEMALLTGEGRSATVTAGTDVDLFTLDKAGFRDILVANPAIASEISTVLAERRDALLRAHRDLTAPHEPPLPPVEFKQRLVDRIRRYFGM